MSEERPEGLGRFQFRDLHPLVSLGTASDRYVGWLGQIYSERRYRGKISSRSKTVGGKTFKEEVLPVESVEEYFQHFSLLELDFTFYRPLTDPDSKPTQNYHVLRTYKRHLPEDSRLILKVPQATFARRLWRGGKSVKNPDYLNPDIFVQRFYDPATELLGGLIAGFIFEQEYQPKGERDPSDQFTADLEGFLESLPRDGRYHMEIRTESLLSEAYFQILEKYGVGQVLSHWTWLPLLSDQFKRSHGKFLNSDWQCILRLMTPLRTRYEKAYLMAFPFNKLIQGMMSPRMVRETVDVVMSAIDQGVHANVVINNRSGGNAPLIAQKVADEFSGRISARPSHQG
jgi:uncharacterized protein YecE (DUF72 family)